jgi:hypothetical protein
VSDQSRSTHQAGAKMPEKITVTDKEWQQLLEALEKE